MNDRVLEFSNGLRVRCVGGESGPAWEILSPPTDMPNPAKNRFADWPDNLPRADLVRMLRHYAGTYHRTEQALATLLNFPLGDGQAIPKDQRVVIHEEVDDLLRMTVELVAELRADLRRCRGTT